MGNAGEVHDPLVAITFPVGISSTDSLSTHMSCLRGDFLWPILARPSLLECEMCFGVCLFCTRDIGGFS